MEHTTNTTIASVSYVALRHGGAPPARARAQLGLSPRVGFELEQLFRKRKGRPLRPRFARDDLHVRAVLRAGGFPVLPGGSR